MALLVAQAKATTVRTISALSDRMRETVVGTEAKTFCAIGTMAQYLGKEIEAATVSAAAMSEWHMRMATDDVRKEVQAQLVQNRADLEWRNEETKKR